VTGKYLKKKDYLGPALALLFAAVGILLLVPREGRTSAARFRLALCPHRRLHSPRVRSSWQPQLS
jgi:hypothetical protein